MESLLGENGDGWLSLLKLVEAKRYVEALEGAHASFVIVALSCVKKAEAEEITRVIAEETAGKILIHGSALRHRLRKLRKQGFIDVNQSKRRRHYTLTKKGEKLAEALKIMIAALKP